jgi:hypothetical protein
VRIVRALAFAALLASCTDEVPQLQPESCDDLYYAVGQPCPVWLFDRCALLGDPFDPRTCAYYEGFICVGGVVEVDTPGCFPFPDAGPSPRDAGPSRRDAGTSRRDAGPSGDAAVMLDAEL